MNIPKHIQSDNKQFYQTMAFIGPFALFLHIIFLIVFYVLDVKEMVIFNIGSILLFGVVTFINYRGWHHTSLVLTILEVVSHQLACVYFVGWEFGFQNYLFPMGLVPFLAPKKQYHIKLLETLIVMFSYFFAFYYLKESTPVATIRNIQASNLFNIINLCSTYIFIGLISFYFSYVAESRLERIHAQADILWDKNEALGKIMANIQQGLCLIKSEMLLAGEYSKYTETILNDKNLEGTNIYDRFIKNLDLGKDLKSSLKKTIPVLIGENLINFDLNAHLLPKSASRTFKDEKKYFEFDWVPIINKNNIIESIMFSIYDVTDLKRAESKILKSNKELEIISQLLNQKDVILAKFFNSSNKLLSLLYLNFQNIYQEDEQKKFLRDLHSLKGNSRSLGFTILSDLTHLAEEYYIQGLKNLDFDLNKRYIEKIEELIYLYHSVAKGKLKKNLEAFDSKITFTDFIKPLVDSSKSILKELEKEDIEVFILNGEIEVPDKYCDLLTSTLNHLIKNSLDHGTLKWHICKINIEIHQTETKLCLKYYDNGVGLNFDTIMNKAKEHNVDTDSLNEKEIAKLIFMPGLSTSINISKVSGRGIGLDAVKSYIEESGGKVDISFITKKVDDHQKFKLIIELPV